MKVVTSEDIHTLFMLVKYLIAGGDAYVCDNGDNNRIPSANMRLFLEMSLGDHQNSGKSLKLKTNLGIEDPILFYANNDIEGWGISPSYHLLKLLGDDSDELTEYIKVKTEVFRKMLP